MGVSENKFLEVMESLMEMYEGGPKSPMALKMYKAVVDRNFSTDQEFEIAAFKLLEDRVYPTFPKPAEFVQAVKPKKEDLESRITMAAVDVKDAIRKHGAYASLAFEDYTIHSVIKYGVGSWTKLCRMELEDIEQFLKWEFPKLYRAYAERKGVEFPLYLGGAAESHNSQLGFNDVRIALVGDEKKIKRWQDAYASRNIHAIPHEKLVVLGYNAPEPIREIEFLKVKTTPEEVLSMHKEAPEEPKKMVRNFNTKEEVVEKYKKMVGRNELTEEDTKVIEMTMKLNKIA